METKKTVILCPKPPPTKKTVATEKPRIKRVVTGSDRWQKEFIEDGCDIAGMDTLSPLFVQQIKQKIAGYHGQDVEKAILDTSLFVVYQDVLDLFKTSELKCYYCHNQVMVLYEYVREPKQWTLERLDNSLGHNRDNVVLACLKCNLRRRCMASEKYVKTKEMETIVKLN